MTIDSERCQDDHVNGRLLEIGRFPVKSMQGEAPPETTVQANGLAGDRAYALVDETTGKVASAKHPRLWAGLLAFQAGYLDGAAPGRTLRIRLPDGTVVRSDDPGVNERLSQAIGRQVRLTGAPAPDATYENEWPDVEGLAPQELIDDTQTSVTDDGRPVSTVPVGFLAPGTFQDVAPVTLLTTASLRAAARLHPAGDWDPRRFRPNLLLDVEGDDFAENDWNGRRLTVGEVVLEVTFPTPRCVMITLAQEELPTDREVLRTLARHNRVDIENAGRFTCLGAYATVVEAGPVAVGDPVRLQS
jgi:hypothetical protein